MACCRVNFAYNAIMVVYLHCSWLYYNVLMLKYALQLWHNFLHFTFTDFFVAFFLELFVNINPCRIILASKDQVMFVPYLYGCSVCAPFRNVVNWALRQCYPNQPSTWWKWIKVLLAFFVVLICVWERGIIPLPLLNADADLLVLLH